MSGSDGVSTSGLGAKIVPILDRIGGASQPGEGDQFNLFVSLMAATNDASSCTTATSPRSSNIPIILSSPGFLFRHTALYSRALIMKKHPFSVKMVKVYKSLSSLCFCIRSPPKHD